MIPDVFINAAQSRKLKNAYLIVCPDISEAKYVINEFLKVLYCERGTGCGECGGCKKAESRNHVDIMTISPENDSIKIEKTRGIAEFIAEKPFEGDRKCVVIEGAECMTAQAQNSILKVIEEPVSNAVFVLATTNDDALLKTIVSRCCEIKLFPVGVTETKNELCEKGVPILKAETYAKLAEGYKFRAISYSENEDFQKARDAAIDVCGRICRAKTPAITAMVNCLMEHDDKIPECIDIMATFFRDIQRYKLFRSLEYVINADCKNEIKKYAPGFTISALNRIIEILIEYIAKKQECKGINNQLMLMAMLFELLEVRLNGGCNRSAL